ncbi:MAG: hypothetical protein ACLF0G_15805 [Candidatus Brocadiia bacterium]
MLACHLVRLLAAVSLAAGAPEGERPERPPLRVVMRTADDLHVGENLRYEDGVFRLRVGGAEGRDVEVAEAQMRSVTLLRPFPHNERASSLVVVAFRTLERGHRGPFMRTVPPPYGIFILPGEPLEQTARALAPKVRSHDLLAFLCADVLAHAEKAKVHQVALDLLAHGEKRAEDRDRAFVFGLMRVVFLHRLDRRAEAVEAMRQLAAQYPAHRDEVADFVALLRLKKRRPGPGRPRGAAQPRP